MKAYVILLVIAIMLCAPAVASESYMVIRLIDPMGPDVVATSGAIQISHPDLKQDEILVYATEEQLSKIQNEPNVALVYPASAELIAGVPVHACTPPKSDLMAEYILNIGRGWNLGGGIRTRLTYSVQAFTPKLDRERTLEMLQQAFAEWEKYVQVDFTYSGSQAAARNLNVLFASGPHGDPFPFDGPRKTLAHTFYPADVNPEPIAGDLHLDNDENWASGVDPDLFSVVLHEVGHALGLGHSDKPTAVMYPYYRRLSTLLPDDIAAIRRLYPARREGPEEVPTTTPTTPQQATPGDTTAPTLRVLSPATTIVSTSAATVRISGTAGDADRVAKVTWTASGGRSGVANGTTTWSIPDIALRLGDNSIIIRAYDSSGNMSWRSLTITRR